MSGGTRRRNVAKLLARLNPKSMAMQPGSGGSGGTAIPFETAIDIAGGLGAAAWGGYSDAKRLAVLVLCLRWWPGLFNGPAKVVDHRVITHRREARRGGVVSAVVYQERIPVEAPAETPAFRSVASLLTTCIQRSIRRDRVRAAQQISDDVWAHLCRRRPPPHADRARLHGAPLADALAERVTGHAFVDAWARLVIEEYRRPHICQTCTPWGRAGEVPRFEGEGKGVQLAWDTCPVCLGGGVMAWGSKRRARALGIGEHAFRDYLKPHHDGALALLRELEGRGARLLLRRLGGAGPH